MFGQNSSNFGYNENNNYAQPSFSNQQNFQNTPQFDPMQSYSTGQSSPNFGQLQNNSMNSFNYQNSASMGQDMMNGQFVNGQNMQNQQYNVGHQGNMNDPNINQNVAEPSVSMYTTYENLPNYGSEINLNDVVESMKMLFSDKVNWKSKFDAVDNLRILNKYHFKMMNEIISVFGPYILECFESQKTCIAKNILMFSCEVFMNAREVRLHNDIISVIVPQVLIKSISEKNILKKEAENALLNLIQNCIDDVTIVTLIKCCFDKNPTICENAFMTLSKVISTIGDNLPSLQFQTLQHLMLTIGKLLDCAKKGNMKKLAQNLCQEMYLRFGVENYKELILNTVSPVHPEFLTYFEKAVEEKKDPKARCAEFSEYRKEKRMSTVYGGYNNQQKMNPQSVLGDPFGAQQQQYYNQSLHYQGNQMPYTQNMQNMQSGYQQSDMFNNNNQQSSLLNGQMGLGFPQSY